MITIFSTPRPFLGHFKIIQQNAISSWLSLGDQIQIILIEDEQSTTGSVANTYGIECISNVSKNTDGVLFLDDIFRKVRKQARGKVLAHINADIILLDDFMESVKLIQKSVFYLTGQRWNLDIVECLDFKHPSILDFLKEEVNRNGKLHPITGMDYWVFPASWNFEMPQFLVGRPAVDNWLIQQALQNHIPVIDCTTKITCIHQNHERGEALGLRKYADEEIYNRRLSKSHKFSESSRVYYFTLHDATHRLDKNGNCLKIPLTLTKILRYRDDPEILRGSIFIWRLLFYPINWFLGSLIYRKYKSMLRLLFPYSILKNLPVAREYKDSI